MLDDNVERCWTIETDEKSLPKKVDGVVQRAALQDCRFSSVMQGMELLLDKGEEPMVDVQLNSEQPNSEYKETIRFNAEAERVHRLACGDGLIAHRKGKDSNQLVCSHLIAALHDYTGRKAAYGVLGMQRNNPQNRLRQSSGFCCTHSVYSFFLLNVRATLDAGVLYPAKPIWEDIEFLHMVSDAGLAVCKFNKYIHAKKHLRTPPPPPPPPATTEITLEQFFQEHVQTFQLPGLELSMLYTVDKEHEWFCPRSSVYQQLIFPCKADTNTRMLVGLQVPEDPEEPAKIIKKLKEYARKRGCTDLVILVQHVATDPAFAPSDDDMLYRMEPRLSRSLVTEQGGDVTYPTDPEGGAGPRCEVDDDGTKYYVLTFSLASAMHT